MEITWHRRLGHRNSCILQLLLSGDLISVNKSSGTLCTSCQISKSSRLPFSLSDSQCSHPLEKIYYDIWGLSPVLSMQEFRFYVVFINNIFWYYWLYPLKWKSEFFNIFLSFQKLVENRFDRKIKVFQFDGGVEFISNNFLTHLCEWGIQQQISCPSNQSKTVVLRGNKVSLLNLGFLQFLRHLCHSTSGSVFNNELFDKSASFNSSRQLKSILHLIWEGPWLLITLSVWFSLFPIFTQQHDEQIWQALLAVHIFGIQWKA